MAKYPDPGATACAAIEAIFEHYCTDPREIIGLGYLFTSQVGEELYGYIEGPIQFQPHLRLGFRDGDIAFHWWWDFDKNCWGPCVVFEDTRGTLVIEHVRKTRQ